MAKRYGALPTQVLKSGSSIDVQCAQIGASYENYLNKKAQNKAEGKPDHNLTQEQMMSMLEEVRKNKKND